MLGYNTPTRTLQLHYTCEVDSKLRSLKITDSNVRKRPFSISQPYKRLRRPLDSIDVLTRPCPLRTGLVGCKYTKKFLIANDFCKKLVENVASSTKKARFLLLSQEIKVCLKSLLKKWLCRKDFRKYERG